MIPVQKTIIEVLKRGIFFILRFDWHAKHPTPMATILDWVKV